MDCGDQVLYLLEEVRGKVVQLEEAVGNILHVKNSLKATSSDVKAQIRDSISRHTEALRNREIWLLSQVELIQQGKEDSLLQKHSELIQMIGGLNKVCSLLEERSAGEKLAEIGIFEEQLAKLLKSVEKMSITTEENPDLYFNGENLELLEFIRKFGQVEADNPNEEYQLASLFKGIDLTNSNSSIPNNKRKYSASSAPIESWLLQGQKHQKYQYTASPMSVEKWLSKCGSDVEVVSEAGYSVKSLDTSELKWVLFDESNQPSLFGNGFPYFNEVKMSNKERWIQVLPKLPDQPKSSLFGETFSKISSMGNEYWLVYKQEKRELRNFSEDFSKIHKLNESNSKMWLQNSKVAENLPETSTGRAFRKIASSSQDQWLQSKNPALESDRCSSKCEYWLLPSANTSVNNDDGMDNDSMSDSDWLNVKEEDVISIENLDSIFRVQSRINTGTPTQGNYTEDKPGIYNKMLQDQPMEDWLQSAESVDEGNENNTSPNNVMKGFLDSLDNDYNKWLSPSVSVSAETCKWLAESSIKRCKNCPEVCSKGLFPIFAKMREAKTDGWLRQSIAAK